MTWFFKFLLFVFCTSASAVNEYYSVTRSVRALGMGNAAYTYTDDEYALFTNPACLSLYRGPAQFMLMNMGTHISLNALSHGASLLEASASSSDAGSILSRAEGIQGPPAHLGINLMPFYLQKGFAFGLLVGDIKSNIGLLGAGPRSEFDATTIADSGFFVGKAGKIASKVLSVGMNGKFLFRSYGRQTGDTLDMIRGTSFSLNQLSSGDLGLGLDFDVGISYEFKPIWGGNGGLSLSVNNILGGTFSKAVGNAPPPALPRTASIGVFTSSEIFSWLDNSVLRVEVAEIKIGGLSDLDAGAREGTLYKHIRLGLERDLFSWLTLRAGLYQGNWTGGVGITLPLVKLDFATYAEELGTLPGRLTSRRFALQVALGFNVRTPKTLFAQ